MVQGDVESVGVKTGRGEQKQQRDSEKKKRGPGEGCVYLERLVSRDSSFVTHNLSVPGPEERGNPRIPARPLFLALEGLLRNQ